MSRQIGRYEDQRIHVATASDRSPRGRTMTTHQNPAKERIRELRNSGLTYAGVARMFGVSASTAKRALEWEPARRGNRKRARSSRVLLSVSQFARIAGIHQNTLRRWSDNGTIKAYRVGPRGDRRYSEDEVESLVKIMQTGDRRRAHLRTGTRPKAKASARLLPASDVKT